MELLVAETDKMNDGEKKCFQGEKKPLAPSFDKMC